MLAKKIFGHDHEITYDTIINHDVYDELRVTLEVPRGQDTEALVLLNGMYIGKILVQREIQNRNGRKYIKTHGYTAARLLNGEYQFFTTPFPKLNKAVASIISDFVKPPQE